MAFGPLRELVLDLNLAVHGVDAVVVRPAPDTTPIATRALWLTAVTEDFPGPGDFVRRAPRRVLALPTETVPTVPLATVVWAPEFGSSTVSRWRVDGLEERQPDHHRVVVIAYPEIPED